MAWEPDMPNWNWSAPSLYTSSSGDNGVSQSDIEYRDGKLIDKRTGKEITKNTIINVQVPRDDEGRTVYDTVSTMAWMFDTVEELLGTAEKQSGTGNFEDKFKYKYTQAPTGTANPLAVRGRDALLTSDYRNVLYGGAFAARDGESISDAIENYDGTQFAGADLTRHEIATKFTVPLIQNSLRMMYPDATQEQLDEAAYKALTVNDPNAPKIHGMAPDQWGRDRTGAVLESGYRDGRYLPTDIIRRIGYFMGGMPEGAEEYLGKWETDNKESLGKLHEAIRSYDKSRSTSFKSVLNDVVTMMPKAADALLSVFPVTAPYWNAAKAVNAYNNGDLKGAVLNAVASYAGATGTDITGGLGNDFGAAIGDAFKVTDTAVQSAINVGAKSAITNATGTLIAGGDFGDAIKSGIIGGVAAGAGSYVQGQVYGSLQQTPGAWEGDTEGVTESNPDYINTVSRGVGGAVTGALNAAGNGKDIVDGLIVGGATGAVNGAVRDLSLNAEVAPDLGTINSTAGGAGGLINTVVSDAVKDDPEPTTGGTGTTPPTDRPDGAVTDDMYGFGSVIPMIGDLVKQRNVDWGKRKFGGG